MYRLHPTWSRIGGILVSLALAATPAMQTLAYAATAASKSETVHVQTDAAGGVKLVTVDELLANDGQAPTLEDRSTLADITPEDEDQSYTSAGDGQLVWITGSKDVSYTGTSSETLPVDVKVSYRLDGKAADPRQLAGASGHLEIRFDYLNNSVTQAENGGSSLSTPFVCLTMALLDSDVFRNVQVENGKVIDDKGGLAVVGYALPGLKESLDLEDTDLDSDLDLPEYLVISADVTDLALDPIYTIVTPELFTDLDTSSLDFDLGDLDEANDALDEAMGALIEGSGGLGSALRQLATGGAALGGGVNALREALGALPSGITALSVGMHGVSDGLNAGSGIAAELANGTEQMAGGAQAALNSALASQGSVQQAQVDVADLRTALEGLNDTKQAIDSASDATAQAQGAAQDASDALKKLDDQVQQQKAPVTEALTSASSESDKAAEQLGEAAASLNEAAAALDALPTEGMSQEQLDALAAAKEKLAAAGGSLDATSSDLAGVRTNLETATTGLDALSVQTPESVKNDIDTLDKAVKALEESKGRFAGSGAALDGAARAQDSLALALAALTETQQLVAGVAGGASQIQAGTAALASLLAQASTGAGQLTDGIDALASSSPQLLTGVDQLNEGVNQLAGALSATADGSDQLTEGLSTFNNEGIKKLEDSLGDLGTNVDDLRDRLDDLRAAAQDYDNFAGKAEGQTGSVRFIYKTEQIG